MPRDYRRLNNHRLFGIAYTTSSIPLVDSNPDKFVSCWVQCTLSTGVSLLISWGKTGDGSDWGYAIIQPGDSLFFTNPRNSDLAIGGIPWDGPIYATGSGGTAGYGGCETYIE